MYHLHTTCDFTDVSPSLLRISTLITTGLFNSSPCGSHFTPSDITDGPLQTFSCFLLPVLRWGGSELPVLQEYKIYHVSMFLWTESEEATLAQAPTFSYRFYQNMLSYVLKSSCATDLVAFQSGVTWFLNVYYYPHPRNQAEIPHYNFFSSCKASLRAIFPSYIGTQMWQFNCLGDHAQNWFSEMI